MLHGIDRGSFLALTFGMAGLACNTGPSPAAPGSVIEIPPQPPQPDAGRAAPTPKPDEPATLRASAPETPATPEDVVEDDDEDDPGMPTAEGGGVAASPSRGCGFVDPATVTRPSGKCSDDQGAVPLCTVMKGCSGFAFPRQKCEAYRRFFKPKVAQRALDCLAKLTAAQACDACNVYRCGDLAMKGSCPDAAADAMCVQITSKCKSVAMADCQRYLSGLNAAGRQKMSTCLTSSSGCGFGIFSCAEGIF